MKNRESHLERPKRRFNKKMDGPLIMKWYAKMQTAELARKLGLTVKQIKNFVYRENIEGWAKKESSPLSRINSEKGRKGGRPRKKH